MDLQFGNYRLKRAERLVLGPEGPVELSARSFDILALLLESPDEVIAKTKLFEAVWPGLVVEENTLQVHISALRKALDTGMVMTVHGRGYKYAGPRPVVEPASSGANDPAKSGATEQSMQPRPSIAVLPFDNMSGDPAQAYFVDGLTEDIITELSKFGELLVIARNSSFQFRGKAVDVKAVGQKLGAQFVVEGSVRKIGSRVRVSAQLIDAASAAHIWAERYDCDLTDVFEIQDEITRKVVASLAGHARSTVANRLRAKPTESLSAYDYFLQAREYFASDGTALQGEPFLRKAIELDPGFADAHAMMSVLHTIKYFHGPERQHLEDALTFGRRALELDPGGPRAAHSIGLALMFLCRLDEAGHYLRQAIALNPNETYFRGDYALWMDFMGDTEGAVREIDEALRRDPYGNDWFWVVRGIIDTTAGRYVDALASFQREKSATPWNHLYLAICYFELGQMAEARLCLGKFKITMPAVSPPDYLAINPISDKALLGRMVDALRQVEADLPE